MFEESEFCQCRWTIIKKHSICAFCQLVEYFTVDSLIDNNNEDLYVSTDSQDFV